MFLKYLSLGEYYCEAENRIENDINKAMSDQMVVNVVGKPQFLSPNAPVIGYQNANTLVEAVFCSDPPPISVKWTYDTIMHHDIE